MNASFIDLFSERADLYASARPTYPDELFAFIAGQAPGRDVVWDCGTGNGQAAAGLARHFRSVWATDPSQAQIDHALPCAGVTYSVQPAEHVAFAGASVDAVTAAQALHWFDPDRFFPEAARVLKPGGLFCAWGYTWSEVTPAVDAVVQEALLAPIHPYWARQVTLLWDGYRDVRMPFPAIPVPTLELRLEWTLLQYLAYLHTWSATRAAITAKGAAFFEAACRQVEQVWGEREQPRLVRMPLTIIAGHSR